IVARPQPEIVAAACAFQKARQQAVVARDHLIALLGALDELRLYAIPQLLIDDPKMRRLRKRSRVFVLVKLSGLPLRNRISIARSRTVMQLAEVRAIAEDAPSDLLARARNKAGGCPRSARCLAIFVFSIASRRWYAILV